MSDSLKILMSFGFSIRPRSDEPSHRLNRSRGPRDF